MGLTSMRQHFRQSKRHIGRNWTWFQRRTEREGVASAICDHILTSNRADFSNVQLKIPRFVTDHHMLKGEMVLGATRDHRRYVQNRRRNPLQAMPSEQSEADTRLEELVKAKMTREKSEDGRANSWISQPTWSLIDERAEANRIGDLTRKRNLDKSVSKAIKKDKQSRINDVANTSAFHLGERCANIRNMSKINTSPRCHLVPVFDINAVIFSRYTITPIGIH